MFSHPSVVLYLLGDYVQNLFAYLEVGFEKRDEIFTIIRVYPHAVLQSDKAS